MSALPAFLKTLIVLVLKLTPAAAAWRMTTVLLGAINWALTGLDRFTLNARSVTLDWTINGMAMDFNDSPRPKVSVPKVLE